MRENFELLTSDPKPPPTPGPSVVYKSGRRKI